MYRTLLMALIAALLMGPGVMAQRADAELDVDRTPHAEAEIDLEETPRAEAELETDTEVFAFEGDEQWESYGYEDSPMNLEKLHQKHGQPADTYGFDEPMKDEDIYGFEDQPGRRAEMERMREEHLKKLDEIIGMLDEAKTAIDEDNTDRAKELIDNARTELETLKNKPCPMGPGMKKPETPPGRGPAERPTPPTEPAPEPEGTMVPDWPGSNRGFVQLV